MRILLTLPAYNEAQALPGLLAAFEKDVLEAGYQGRVVVVDDGSTDTTADVLREWSARLPIEVVRHAGNRGLGETIEDGLRRAAELAAPEDVVVTMDADGTHSPALIPEMVARLGEGCDVVIASRYRPGSAVVGLSALRRVMSFGARILFQLRYSIPGVRDYTCGFRAYRAPVLQGLFAQARGRLVREQGFAAMAEILLRLRGAGVRMCEVPMVLRYDRKAGPGKMRVGRTVARTLALLARHRVEGGAGTKANPVLPVERTLRRAEALALRATREPGPEVAAALGELAPALLTWGRREAAAKIEQACQGREKAEVTGDSAAREIVAAARELRAMQEEIHAAFDRDSSDEEHFPSTIDSRIYHVKLILDFFGDLSHKRALDVGCGKGRFARILHERNPEAEIWGLDISAEMLRYVPEGIHTKQGVMTDLPFPDAHFDAVYATESLEHAVEIEAAVAEMCRVTKPGGKLVIIDKNIEKAGTLATPAWEKWFGRREIERLLARDCSQASSEFISYWEDIPPDGLFLAWKAIR